jgi:hypothetical protein
MAETALRLIAVAAVGIALEAPIFVAVTLTFALVAFLGAAIDASMRHPWAKSLRIGRHGRSATMPGDRAASR